MDTKRKPTWYAGILEKKVNVIFGGKDKNFIAQMQDICKYFLFNAATVQEIAHEFHISQSDICLSMNLLKKFKLIKKAEPRCCHITGHFDDVWLIDCTLLNKEPVPIENILKEVSNKVLIDKESGELNLLVTLNRRRNGI